MTRELLTKALASILSCCPDDDSIVKEIRAHLAQPQGEPVLTIVTRREFHEYGSAKEDTVGYLANSYRWAKLPETEGTIHLFTHPAHTEAEVEEMLHYTAGVYEEEVRRILGVPAP